MSRSCSRPLERRSKGDALASWGCWLPSWEPSKVKVTDVWRKSGLQPWGQSTLEFSTDPQLEAKVREVIGLYINPPDKALALSRVDEHSQVQAMDRTAPTLGTCGPGSPGSRPTTTSAMAPSPIRAVKVATSNVTDAC